MKLLRILILITGATIFEGCTVTRHVTSHADLPTGSPPAFRKFTEEEKDSMTEAVGRKIDWNHQSCILNHKSNVSLIIKHNAIHD